MYRINNCVDRWVEILRSEKEVDRPKLISDLFGLQRDVECELRTASNESKKFEVELGTARGRIEEMKERLESRAIALCLSIMLNAAGFAVISYVLMKK